MSQADYELLDAGSYNDEDAYNDETDGYDVRKIRVNCPHCNRETAALCSTKTKLIDAGWRWVGADHREPYAAFRTTCSSSRGCGKDFIFTTYTAQ